MQLKTSCLLVLFLTIFSLNGLSQHPLDYYLVHYRNCVEAKVITVNHKKIKLSVGEVYKGTWKTGSRQTIALEKGEFNLHEDSSYIMILGGHVRFLHKWKLRSNSHAFKVSQDSLFISCELLQRITIEGDSISKPIESYGYKTSKNELVNLILELNKTYEYCYSHRYGRISRERIGIKKKTEIPLDLTPFQQAIFLHFDDFWMNFKCE